MFKKLFKKIQSKWDFWIYCRFFHSIKRICEEKSGWSHNMELHLRDYNQSHPIDEKLKESAELFYNSAFKTK